jgi:hypothetical protein
VATTITYYEQPLFSTAGFGVPDESFYGRPVHADELGGFKFKTAVIKYVIEDGDVKSDAVTIPIGSRVVGAMLRCDTLVACTTAVKVGLGTSGDDPDEYGKTAALTANSKVLTNPDISTALAAADEVSIIACATGGTSAGSFDSGTITAVIGWIETATLPDLS